MNKPKTSFAVVMNGPVASAGSIPYLSRIRGTDVPNKLAKMITVRSERLTVKANA